MQVQANPQAMQQIQQDPQAQEQAQQLLAQGQSRMQELQSQATVEDVLAFLRDNRARNFVLDIETDSTIQLDEQQEKEQRGEFVTMLSGLIQQIGTMIVTLPQTAKFGGEVLKFAIAPYRAGRSLDGAIDEMTEQLNQMAASGQLGQGGQPGQGQGQQTDPAETQAKMQIEQMKMQHQAQENDKDRQIQIAELQSRAMAEQKKIEGEKEVAMLEYQGNEKERQAKIMQIQAQMQRDHEKHAADLQKSQADFVLNNQKQQIAMRGQQEKNAMVREGMMVKAQGDAMNRQQKAAQFNQASQQKAQQFNQGLQQKDRQAMMPKGPPRQ